MSFKFPTINDWASIGSQDWVLGATKLSFATWARIDTIRSGYHQYLFNFRGASGYWGARRADDGKWKITAYTNGLYRSYVAGSIPAAGEIWHLAGSWQAGLADGWRWYENGSLHGTASTLSQTDIAIGSPTLWISALGYNNSPGLCSLENLVIARDYIWRSEDVEALRHGAWPQWIIPAGVDWIHFAFFDELMTRVPDLSGGARHLESGGILGAVAGGLIGKCEDPGIISLGATRRSTAAATPPPADWTEWPYTIPRDQGSVVISGLTNGVPYQFMVRAEDGAGNLSAESSIVEATPEATLKHVPRTILFYAR